MSGGILHRVQSLAQKILKTKRVDSSKLGRRSSRSYSQSSAKSATAVPYRKEDKPASPIKDGVGSNTKPPLKLSDSRLAPFLGCMRGIPVKHGRATSKVEQKKKWGTTKLDVGKPNNLGISLAQGETLKFHTNRQAEEVHGKASGSMGVENLEQKLEGMEKEKRRKWFAKNNLGLGAAQAEVLRFFTRRKSMDKKNQRLEQRIDKVDLPQDPNTEAYMILAKQKLKELIPPTVIPKRN